MCRLDRMETLVRNIDFMHGTHEKWGMPDAPSLITFLSARRKLIFEY